ncbi:hypothetical protein Rsub_09485 [Raphidocelis subcapitata]|uniref:ARID domain-containing protein n=1 Tax=Raphidocelis subcapitata TaxID=307507 RepID=A0A2V0PFR9_9CHLO|nr:hypothetical protein Rsub_09485 [Raphidocelis subcapitata]|eukprot:GBF96743.1 hypothetical protein Rsub_09485 [Raphidocelis subcapitata]
MQLVAAAADVAAKQPPLAQPGTPRAPAPTPLAVRHAMQQQEQHQQAAVDAAPRAASAPPFNRHPRGTAGLQLGHAAQQDLSRPLPGDGDPRVAAMAAYLAGTTQQLPPRHLLPPAAVNPAVAGRAVDLRALFRAVVGRGGHLWVTLTARWGEVLGEAGLGGADPAAGAEVAAQALYENVLLRFERMYYPEAWLAATGHPSPLLAAAPAPPPSL